MYNNLLIVLSTILTLEGVLISARTLLLSPSSAEYAAEDMPPPWKDSNEYLDEQISNTNNDKSFLNNLHVLSNDELARTIIGNAQSIPIFNLEDLSSKHHLSQENINKYQKYLLTQLQKNSMGSNDETLLPIEMVSSKRGLSMLARWKPFSDLGRDRTPIRSAGDFKTVYGTDLLDGTVVSAQTRARPAGQPLRWG